MIDSAIDNKTYEHESDMFRKEMPRWAVSNVVGLPSGIG